MKALRTLLMFTALCAGTPLAAAYTVKAGDTLQSVARRYNLEPVQLMQLNGLGSTTLQVGQRLEVGAEDTPAAAAPARPAAAPATAARGTSAPSPLARGAAFVRTAATRFLGVRYALGGTSGGGLDCSGYTLRVFQQLGINLPRTAAGQWRAGAAVSRRDLRPGDLVFFNTTGRVASHVGIYLGDGLMAGANSYHGRTMIEPLFGNPYWANRYIGARRVLS